MEGMIWKIIGLILIGLLLLLLVPAAVQKFTEIYSSVFFRADWESLSGAEKSQMQLQFDNFANNVNSCRIINKQSCLCKDLIIQFPDGVIIKIIHGKDEIISLFYGKYNVKNFTINNSFINGFSFSDSKILESKIVLENKIEFKKSEKFFNGDKIISSGFYKISEARLGIITTDKISEDKQLPTVSRLQSC
jgi:hypothetical protein